MAGYRNRIITKTFPALAEEGDHIEVVLRNPRLIPPAELQSAYGKANLSAEEIQRMESIQQALADGDGTAAEAVTEEDAHRGYNLLARLIVGWHVYDASSTADDQPLLPLPATPELVAKLPMEILMVLTEELNGANPQRTPAIREATSGTS